MTIVRTILLSFTPYWFDRLENNTLKFEYRKHFPQDDSTVYFYISSPIKAISGCAYCLHPEPLCTWLERFKDRPNDVLLRINDYLKDCRYAVPIRTFQKTNKITLQKLQQDIPNFIVPRMYYYIDNSDLLQYLESNLIPVCPPFITNLSEIQNSDICC